MAHFMTEPASTVALTGEIGGSVALTNYKTSLTSERLFDGNPFSQVGTIAVCLDGDPVTIKFPGQIEGLTAQQVQNAVRTLNFIRVKFTGLTLTVTGDQYNRVTYSGVAEKAELVTAAPAAGKS